MDFINSMILATEQQTFPWQMLVVLVAFIVFYYFLFIRPQSKKRKDLENMLKNIKKGDKVITIGGIHGKVSITKDNEVTLKVDANTEITFDRAAISRVVVDQPVKSKQEIQGNQEKKSLFGFGKKNDAK